MGPSAEPCQLSGYRGEPSAPTAEENQLGMFEKSLREKVHNEWAKLCRPTAKCEKCQRQACEVLQTCCICTWNICRKCSQDTPGLRKSEGPCHILDHNAVDWTPKDSTDAEKNSTNSQKKNTNAKKNTTNSKKNTTNAKKTTTRRAKRVKTADKVEITLVPVTEELQASGISLHAKGQILPPPLQGKAHKAIQTMPAIYPPHRYPESLVDDEHDEIVASRLTQRQNSNSLSPDRQENPSTTKGSFVPARILQPNPSTYPHLPSPYPSGPSLPLQYTTIVGRVTHSLPREPSPSHTKLRQPPSIRHGSPVSVQIWIPPFGNPPKVDSSSRGGENVHKVCVCGFHQAQDRIDHGKQTFPEPGPPRPYETPHSTRQEFTPTRVCEEEPSKEQVTPECFTTPRNLIVSQLQEYHGTKPILGKRGRPTFTLLEPQINV